MKWLIIQSAGEHQGQDSWTPNHYLRECFSLQDAIHHHGHQADVWGKRHVNYSQVPDFKAYDAIVVAENYEMEWLPDLSGVDAIKIHWIIDLHIQGHDPYLPITRQCTHVWHATNNLMDAYAAKTPHAKHSWFPNAVDTRYFNFQKMPHVPRHRDIVFVGGRGAREAILKTMEAEAGLKSFYGVTGWDYISLLHVAKIQFNAPANMDINYRTFETIAMGACLLTAYDPDLAKLGFKHDVNCLLYSSPQEAVTLARHAMRLNRWQEIGQAGAKLTWHNSYRSRFGWWASDMV